MRGAQATDLGGVLPNANTADGTGVLTTVSSGSRDSGFGFDTLLHNFTANDNTAIGNTPRKQQVNAQFTASNQPLEY